MNYKNKRFDKSTIRFFPSIISTTYAAKTFLHLFVADNFEGVSPHGPVSRGHEALAFTDVSTALCGGSFNILSDCFGQFTQDNADHWIFDRCKGGSEGQTGTSHFRCINTGSG